MNSLARSHIDHCVKIVICCVCGVLMQTAQAKPPCPASNQTKTVNNTANVSTPVTPRLHRSPGFRGINGSGVAADDDPPANFDHNTNLLWSAKILPGASSPCIWDDRIFLTGYHAGAKKLYVGCYNRKDGALLWAKDAGARKIETIHGMSSPASGTIATDGERIYVYFGSVGLLCYDFAGEPIWKVEMPLPDLRNGSGTSPIVAGDLVLLNRESKDDSYLLAVNKRTGAEVWKYAFNLPPGEYNRSTATPILWKDQVIVHMCSGVHAFALSDGKLIWQYPTNTNGVATPVIWGNQLFVSTWRPAGDPVNRGKLPTFQELIKEDKNKNGKISFKEFPWGPLFFYRPESSEPGGGGRLNFHFLVKKMDTDNNGDITQQEWKAFEKWYAEEIEAQFNDTSLLSIRLGREGIITTTHVKKLAKKEIPEVASPLVHQGRIYTIADGGRLRCVDVASGKELYLKRIRATGSYYASPIAAGDKIYLASVPGVITVLQAGDEFKQIASNNLGERIVATPAIVDDTFYVRTNEHLYAFKKTE